ncbi:TIGR00730 family Rossman fold protein [Hyalangium rubrum]|uniref:Cytokinin riboside 5'-monophosphate phosphoribohydrolase n=1 Tax=Hyalangium rubrum TaxID=3103134 RepID=A0ABU5H8N1_9BACT|nr:TIGR00730 family Rossman fold protein [Hyalangium sp. s54d21]MDY7229464.1 TIGR00730 family Rossman fold protein [Hyalangium sp. s54d21]
MDLQTVCVFCGSRPGARPEFLAAAQALGAELARRRITLIYGGASVGLMGALADATLAGGGRAVGVLPFSLQERELGHSGLHELHLVNSMHERKALMAKRADAFIAMPGGFGTFDELFEILTWGQLGLHQKPIGLLNVGGYFEPLQAMVRRGVEDGFIPPAQAEPFAVSASAGELLDRLQAGPTMQVTEKWIRRTEET